MENAEITLDRLIEIGERIYENNFHYSPPPPSTKNCLVLLPGHTTFDNCEYETWKNNVLRFLYKNLPNDISIQLFKEAANEFDKKSNTKSLFVKMLGVVKSLKNIPELLKLEDSTSNISTQVNITNSNNQSQTQSQQQSVEIFIEAIKDDLTGKQVKELKEIVAEEDGNLEKAKPKILDKIKSWTGDVAAGIVTNLITNPTIWGGM